MRVYSKVFFLTLSAIVIACSHRSTPYLGEVNYVSKDAQGTIIVKASGEGSNKEEAIFDAQKNAFNIIMFKGIPGTELNIPLVENEYQAKAQHPDYFKRFFEQNYYKPYVMSSNLSGTPFKIKGGFRATVDLKINYNSLRNDLTQNQIIRKFGY